MSTYLDFRCEDCREDACLSVQFPRIMEAPMRLLLDARDALAVLGRAGHPFKIRDGGSDVLAEPAFFAAHAGHRIVIVNGYGNVVQAPEATARVEGDDPL